MSGAENSPCCLSDAEIVVLQTAQPGRAPEALARHLASCERCQARALFGTEGRPGARKPAPDPPSLRRGLLYVALVLGAMAAFFWTLRMLLGPGE
jgi:hypothetical protein